MELFFLIVIGIILIIMLMSFRQEVKKNIRVVNQNVKVVHKELKGLKEQFDHPDSIKPQTTQPEASKAEPQPLRVTGQKLVSQPKKTEEKPAEKPKPAAPKVNKPLERKPKPVVSETKPEPIKPASPKPVQKTELKSEKVNKVNKPAEKRDYEKLIGENWLNKIGIAILVIGIGFFVKYAIDKNWIGEMGRTAIGLGTGGLLVGIAHFLRKKYRAFSSVLIGGGISVLYYTISIAYHDYGLFTQKAAFLVMVLITSFSTLMSVLYDRKELAIISLVGAFTSPFMVQGETDNYVAFFTYISIINAGMLILSYFKKWPILTRLALGFTTLFFGTWIIITGMTDPTVSKWALIFASIYFVQFTAMILVYNFVKKIRFNAWEYVQTTAVTALYYGVVMYLLNIRYSEPPYGIFTIIMAAVFSLTALFSTLKKGTDKGLTYLLIGKAITFISLSGVVLFESNYMTLFWAIEAVVLLALGQKTNMKVLKNASILITLFTGAALVRDWVLFYGLTSGDFAVIANKGFMTGLFSILTFVATFFLLKREKAEESGLIIPAAGYRNGVGTMILSGAYLTILLELVNQLDRLYFQAGETLIIWLFHIIIVIGGILLSKYRKSDLLKQVFFFIGIAGTIAYLTHGQYNNIAIRDSVVTTGYHSVYYYLHFLLVAGVVAILFLIKNLGDTIFEETKQRNWFRAALSVIGLIIATVELDQIVVFAFGNTYGIGTVLKHTQAEGYTVLWGIYSFLLIIWGMKKKNRVMRILALIMFSATLLKLFVLDIQNISEAGKIVAFISLGVLLLIVSFMYQKLKQIIVGENN